MNVMKRESVVSWEAGANKWSLVFLMVLLWGAVAPATVVRQISFRTLVDSSELVIHGVVRDVVEEPGLKEVGGFHTLIEIEVLEAFKGQPGGREPFRLVLPGGRVGNRVMKIPGMPRFHSGDEAVFFLERIKGGYALTGLHQGVYWVQDRGENGKWVESPLREEGTLWRGPYPLEHFIKRLYGEVGQP